MMSVVRSCIHW